MRAQLREKLTTVWALSAVLCCSLAACSSSEAPQASATSAPTSHKQPKVAGKPGETGLNDMVGAVSAAKAGPPIEMRFSLPSRPEVGQVMDLEVAVIPRTPVPDSVSVSFQVVDGLEIADGSQLERVEKLVDGVPIRHIVKVLPKRDGIFAVTAVASFISGSQESTRVFSIPVISGEGLQEQVAKGP